MAKAKSRNNSSSAAKRREQLRQQRQGSINSAQSQMTRKTGRKPAPPKRSPWLAVGGTIVLIAVIVGFFIFLSHQSSSSSNDQNGTPANAGVLQHVTNVDPALLSQIGTGGVANPFKLVQGSPPLLTGPNGKPEVFYFGAEFCPYCAAERWSIIVALSHFGTFHNLRETSSSSTDVYPSTSTFTFYASSYSSSYIDFVPLENEDGQHNILQTPTAGEQQILNRYNVNGYPFMDIGDRYLIQVPSFDPTVLRSNPSDPNSSPLSQQEIANQLSTENTVSKSILGTANYLTAAICSITKNQPANVCNDSSIQQIEASLSHTAQSTPSSANSSLIAFAGYVQRKQGLAQLG